MHKTTVVTAALLLVVAQGATYPNATLGRRAEPGPAVVGPCTDDQAYCSGPEDYCCPLDLECAVDEDAGTYNCVLPDAGPDPEPEPQCTEEQTLCGETCCPGNSACMGGSSCLVCLSSESPCGNICCGAGSTCNEETSTCEREGGITTGGGGSTTTNPPGGSSTRGGTNPTTTGSGGSSISVGGTNTSGPNSASAVGSGAWFLVGTLLAFIGA